MVVNTRLADFVERKQQLLDVQELELYNLEQRLEHVWDEDELLDRAKMMGYVQTGETPYYFIHDGEYTSNGNGTGTSGQNGKEMDNPPAVQTFKGISLWANLGLALIVSCVLVGIAKIVGRSRKGQDFSRRTGAGHGDYRR